MEFTAEPVQRDGSLVVRNWPRADLAKCRGWVDGPCVSDHQEVWAKSIKRFGFSVITPTFDEEVGLGMTLVLNWGNLEMGSKSFTL
ncbi:MAG: hypothetical protein EA368_01700 [Leptolyngbya sp. DLM2.Bin27]|nr:MAG: hypothetical protein EA368_01700 [Leptolyngbya sp. DLM2.Bin27]